MSDFSTRLLETLTRLTGALAPSGYCVGYSGGLDSTLLLQALAALALPAPLRAVHVHHGLHPCADEWQRHCRDRAERWGVPLTVLRVAVPSEARDGLEAAARRARYAALAGALRSAEVLLTAHHRDDQLETVLLQLVRGGGPAGLAAMPALRRFAAGWHCRPLLGWDRARLSAEAAARGLDWVEDTSNRDASRDRNFLRATIVPALRGRWPGVAASIARSAAHCAEAAALLATEANAALRAASDGERLGVTSLLECPPAKRRLLLRAWLAGRELPMPTTRQLEQIERVLSARADATPCVRWPGGELRRYRGWLYAGAPLPDWPEGESVLTRSGALSLPGGGELRLEAVRGSGLHPRYAETPLAVRYRRGGERIRVRGNDCRQSLKKLLQAAHVPPWLRGRIPLLYDAEHLVAVGDLWIADAAGAAAGEQGWRIVWRNRPF